MKRLIIIAGASGAGKSFVLDQITKLSNAQNNTDTIMKFTTRPERSPNEPSKDLLFDYDEKELKETCEFTYVYGEGDQQHIYGIKKSSIDKTLDADKTPVVIVRDCEEIKSIKQSYPNALTLYVHSGLSGEKLEKKLSKLGRKDISNIEERNRRIIRDASQYEEFIKIFDHTIINYYEEEPLRSVLKKILYSERENTRQKASQVFVMMSFSSEFDWVYQEMQLAIEIFNSRHKYKLDISRISDQKGKSFKITNAILNGIAEAELVICDLTEERPNVYYELGHAEGTGKDIILTAMKGTKIHFDIYNDRIEFYENSVQLRENLIHNLEAHYGVWKSPKIF